MVCNQSPGMIDWLLELGAARVARPVLRGGGGSDATSLPNQLSGHREDPLAARGHRRRDQYRSACRLAGGAAPGHDADLALCGPGACARPVLGDPLRLNRTHTPLSDFSVQCRLHMAILYYRNY